jgi:hypothetical protein
MIEFNRAQKSVSYEGGSMILADKLLWALLDSPFFLSIVDELLRIKFICSASITKVKNAKNSAATNVA